MRTAEETMSWLIFVIREDFSTTFTGSACSIMSKASLLSSRRVLVKLQSETFKHAYNYQEKMAQAFQRRRVNRVLSRTLPELILGSF